MIKTTIPNDSTEVLTNDSTIPERFRSILGSVVTVLDVIKKTLLQQQSSQGRNKPIKGIFWKNSQGTHPRLEVWNH